MQPIIIASGARASRTHHEVRAATVTIAAATSSTATNGNLKHIIGFSFGVVSLVRRPKRLNGYTQTGEGPRQRWRWPANPSARRRTCRVRHTRTRTRFPGRPAAVCAPGEGGPSRCLASRREARRSADTSGRERREGAGPPGSCRSAPRCSSGRICSKTDGVRVRATGRCASGAAPSSGSRRRRRSG